MRQRTWALLRSAQWVLDQQQSRAVLRLEGGPELFSSAAPEAIFFSVATPPLPRRKTTLSIRADRDGASLPAASEAVNARPSSFWVAEVGVEDLPSFVVRIIGSSMPVTIAVVETVPIIAQPSSLRRANLTLQALNEAIEVPNEISGSRSCFRAADMNLIWRL